MQSPCVNAWQPFLTAALAKALTERVLLLTPCKEILSGKLNRENSHVKPMLLGTSYSSPAPSVLKALGRLPGPRHTSGM